MSSFVFASGNNIHESYFDSLVTFDEQFEQWFDVVLKDENELFILFHVLGIDNVIGNNLSSSEDFAKLYDCSAFDFPELDQQQFDSLYEKWLKESGRESDMDEYGQFIFIQSYAREWNKNVNRIVLLAKL